MEMDDTIGSIEAVDKYTVVFNLKRVEAPFLANMGMDFASIMSKEHADAMMAAGTPEKKDQRGSHSQRFVTAQVPAAVRQGCRCRCQLGTQVVQDIIGGNDHGR